MVNHKLKKLFNININYMSLKIGAAVFIVILLCSPFFSKGKDSSIALKSPDKKLIFHISADSKTGVNYYVDWKNQTIIGKSALGFRLIDNTVILDGEVSINSVGHNSVDTIWHPVYGEQSVYSDHYNEILIRFKGDNQIAKHIGLRVRAYDEGIAFRYEFDQKDTLKIAAELSEFTFNTDPTVWVSKSAQSSILKRKLSEVSSVCERPLLAELNDSVYVSFGEAALVDFARMKFQKAKSAPNKLVAYLETEVGTSEGKRIRYPIIVPGGGYNTPWRTIMPGKSPSTILQNNSLILNLNQGNQITDPSWIKPGKVIREVTLTTQGGIACIDFAVKHNLQFIEFDAGWYGCEYENASDASTITVDPKRSSGPLDMHQVIDYGKKKGIGVILYINRRAMEKQLDQVLPLYKSWGVAGLKYGFVNVGSQRWTTWLHEAVRKAAENQLMVDIHDEYRPTGYSRTFPNLMTQEGIRGDEESTPNNMVINTIFTRMIAGAGDQTNCYFAERVTEKMGSHASQMAKAICIYSPWQFLYWYDRPDGSSVSMGGAGGATGTIPEIPDLEFYDRIPTVWDQTKIIDGYPGERAVIAREKKGSWYIGAISGNHGFELKLKLGFLKSGIKYEAMVFSDDSTLKLETKLKIQKLTVNQSSILDYQILKQNGLAVIIAPIK